MNSLNQKFDNIDEYVVTFPKNVQEILQKIRKIVKDASPDITEGIAYDMPTYKLNDRLVMHFAAFKKHIGLYGITMGEFREELEPLLAHRGTIQLKYSEPIPYDLVKSLVKIRVNNILSK
ncbi:MAG: iron chaperone [Candidatus Dojkabacteria bacterium]